MAAPRLLTVWCPDWPLVAQEVPPEVPAAVLVGEQVLACTRSARVEGVRRGLRRREAQRRCPELRLVDRDELQEARAFEPVLTALEAVCPFVEVQRPGQCAFPATGSARYFGGDQPLVQVVTDALQAVPTVGDPAGVGIADGRFASGLAARRSIVVPARGSAAFLAPLAVGLLGASPLVDLFVRLGLRTLGEVAGLPARQVVSRFGTEGVAAHRLARGLDERPVSPREAPLELAVEQLLEDPVDSVDQLTFVAKRLADQLRDGLAERGLGCTRVLVEVETEHGESRSRLWRYSGTFTASALAQRVRWQLAGWLDGPVDDRPSAGVTLLRLTPDEVHHETGQQLRLFDDATGGAVGDLGADERAGTALARLQGLLGFDAVHLAVPSGGRGPTEQVTLVPWGEPLPRRYGGTPPWPGRLPTPSPTLVHDPVLPAQLLDASGALVAVGAHGVSAAPHDLSVRGGRPLAVTAWAGPWPVDERWWDPAAHTALARFHVVTADGSARLLAVRDGAWWVEGTYH